ncbi:MAG: hypothetical protein HQK58_15025, partial [Deltaproteobacteria bacterium]|nr:hypothetical protein [Deltaproteobacteria bacterium]
KQGRDDITNLLAPFDGALRLVLDSLAGISTPVKEARPDKVMPTADRTTLMSLVEKMEPLIQKRSPKPLKTIMEEVSGLSWPEEYQNDMSNLYKLINKYKFREAAELLTSIVSRLKNGE